MKVASGFFYVVSVVWLGFGFFKLYAYRSSQHDTTPLNAYVGSDAHNLIINSAQSAAYFILAMFFMILASLILIIDRLPNNKEIITLEEYREQMNNSTSQ